MVDKEHILAEIRRTAEANGGKPLGISRFFQETGIRRSDWHGKIWARWGDALLEAGFKPNVLQSAYSDEFVLKRLISLIRELEKYPTMAEIKIKARSDPEFPSHNVFTRLGNRAELIRMVMEYCGDQAEYVDVMKICSDSEPNVNASRSSSINKIVAGYVYLMKSGKFYKIGRSSAVGRREYELSIKLPEKLKTIHMIETDDPAGIEAYWHKRFQEKRKRGEWFELGREDVNAFRRRKYM